MSRLSFVALIFFGVFSGLFWQRIFISQEGERQPPAPELHIFREALLREPEAAPESPAGQSAEGKTVTVSGQRNPPNSKTPDLPQAPVPGPDLTASFPKFISGILPSSGVVPLSADEIYQKLYLAVVQVICERENNAVVTGSGVIVSPEGVVLTNAHVVEQAKQCFVKTGNPAVSLGKLRIVFAGNTTEKIAATLVPKEDFALGKISDVVSSSAAKPPFKYLDLDAEYVMRIGDGFYAAAYPTELIGSGGFLAGKQNLVYTTTKVIDAFRVDDASVTYDVIELEGSIATQQGSSGSPIISPRDGSVIGIVFGQTGLEIDNGFEPPTIVETARRTELAFLVSHLDRTIKKEKGKSLSEFIRELSLE